MKPLIWKQNQSIHTSKPDKESVLKIEDMGKTFWWGIKYKEDSYDSFFGKTAHSIDEAKTICEEMYHSLKSGVPVSFKMGNQLP